MARDEDFFDRIWSTAAECLAKGLQLPGPDALLLGIRAIPEDSHCSICAEWLQEVERSIAIPIYARNDLRDMFWFALHKHDGVHDSLRAFAICALAAHISPVVEDAEMFGSACAVSLYIISKWRGTSHE